MSNDLAELKRRYETLATSGDHKTTACDYQLREMEIATALEYMGDGHAHAGRGLRAGLRGRPVCLPEGRRGARH